MAVAAVANSKPKPNTSAQPPNVTKNNQAAKPQAAKPSPQPANSQMSRALLARWEYRLERLRNSKEESQTGATETNRNSLRTIYKEAQEAGVFLPHPTWNDAVFNGMSLIGGKIDDEEAEAREAEGEQIELEEVEEGGATDEELEEEAQPSPPPNKKAAATPTAPTTSGKKGGATGKADGQAGKASTTTTPPAQAAAIKRGTNTAPIPAAQMPQATLTKKEKLRIANEEREERLAAKKAAKGEEPAAPKAKKAKKEVVFNPCLCGCSRQVPGRFAPGHDAKVKQMILGVEREVIKQKDLPETLRFLKFKREPVGPEGALVLQVQNSPVKIPGRERQEAE